MAETQTLLKISPPPELQASPDALKNAVEPAKLLLREHGYVLISGLENMTPEQMRTFVRLIAPGQFMIPFDDEASASLTDDAIPAHAPGVPEVRVLGRGHPGSLLASVGYEWHQDGGGTAPFLTLLHCRDACPGADTLFADGEVLFNRLSDADQSLARSLTAVYSNEHTAGGPTALDAARGLRMSPCGTKRIRPASSRKLDWTIGRFRRPVVEVGPDDRPRLLAGAKGLERIVDHGTEESCDILSRLLRSALSPRAESPLDDDLRTVGTTAFDSDAVYVHKWQNGQAILWDNHRMLHSTVPVAAYEQGRRRLMWQVISKAEAMVART